MGLKYCIAALLSRQNFAVNWLKTRDWGAQILPTYFWPRSEHHENPYWHCIIKVYNLRYKLWNVDELTSTSRRIDLGQICSISDHKSWWNSLAILIFLGFEIGQRWAEAVMHSRGGAAEAQEWGKISFNDRSKTPASQKNGGNRHPGRRDCPWLQ